RVVILDAMARVIAEPRTQLSPFAPRIITIEINPEKIRVVIGPGGKVINKIKAETGVKIDIEQDRRVLIASVDEKAAQKATAVIEAIVREVKAGELYLGRVTRMMNFGAFVEVLAGKEGLGPLPGPNKRPPYPQCRAGSGIRSTPRRPPRCPEIGARTSIF